MKAQRHKIFCIRVENLCKILTKLLFAVWRIRSSVLRFLRMCIGSIGSGRSVLIDLSDYIKLRRFMDSDDRSEVAFVLENICKFPIEDSSLAAYSLWTAFSNGYLKEILVALEKKPPSKSGVFIEYLKALSLCELGMLKLAEERSRCAMAMFPDQWQPVVALAKILSREGRYIEIEALLCNALKTLPVFGPCESLRRYYQALSPKRDAGYHRSGKCPLESLVIEAQQQKRDEPIKLASSGKNRHRLKIGFVSADFRDHPVGNILSSISEPLSRHFDLYFFGNNRYLRSWQRSRLLNGSCAFDIRKVPDLIVARQIKQIGVDVLIDLSGHTNGNRLDVFKLRPAPVQVSWLGFPDSTGLQEMDYRIVDNFTVPPFVRMAGTEAPLRLDNVFSCYHPWFDAGSTLGCRRNAPKSGFRYGSLHKLEKINDEVIATWSLLLKFAAETKLVIGRDNFSPPLAASILKRFRYFGVHEERIQIKRIGNHRSAISDFCREVDLMLDVFPWSGHIVCCDALAAGLPVVTIAGEFHSERMVASVLHAAGFGQDVSDNQNEYVKKASEYSEIDIDRQSRAQKFRGSLVCRPEDFAQDFAAAINGIVK